MVLLARSHDVCYVADVLMLMASGESEPRSNVSTQEDDALTPSNKSQADSLSGFTGGFEGSESGLSLRSSRRLSSSTARSPVLSSPSDGQTGAADSQTLEQNSWDSRGSEMESWMPGSGEPKTARLQDLNCSNILHKDLRFSDVSRCCRKRRSPLL